jgi:hypothetical protein
MPFKVSLDGEQFAKTSAIPYFLSYYSNNLVRIVDNSSSEYLISIGGPEKLKSIAESSKYNHSKIFYILVNEIGERNMNNIRHQAHFVDQELFKYKHFKFPIFTHLDLKNPYVINVPLGFTNPKLIEQSMLSMFNIECSKVNFTNRVFWRGGRTHQIRRNLHSLILDNPERYSHFTFHPQNTLYELHNFKKLPDAFYKKYIRELANSDFVFNIRGDLPWTFSFWDILRSTSIPININCMYQDIGFENVGIDIEKMTVNLDTDIFDEEYILEYMKDLQSDIDLVLEYKTYIKDVTHFLMCFFRDIYKASNHLNLDFWKIIPSWLIAKKILNILQNPNHYDNKLLCRESLKI